MNVLDFTTGQIPSGDKVRRPMTEDLSIPGHTLIEIFKKFIKHIGKKNIKSAQMQSMWSDKSQRSIKRKKISRFCNNKKGPPMKALNIKRY
jgi:hypothetical protein